MLQDWITAIEGWIPAMAGSPWAYPALAMFAMIDGFFPPIPSESVVIALASVAVTQGSPNLLLIALAAAVGAWVGDQIAYQIGAKVNVHRIRFFRGERGAKALAWAEHALRHRGSSFILAARYVPIGRVAVNMTAGALGYPRRRFMGLTALAGATWAGYGTLIGLGAGVWLEDHPLIAVVVGVVVGTVVGLAIDWVLRRFTRVSDVPLGAVAAATAEQDLPIGEPGADDGPATRARTGAAEPSATPVVTPAPRPAARPVG